MRLGILVQLFSIDEAEKRKQTGEIEVTRPAFSRRIDACVSELHGRVAYRPICGGVCTMESNKQNTTKIASPAATIMTWGP